MIIEGRPSRPSRRCWSSARRRHADPSALRPHVPQNMRVAEITLADGRKVYDVLVSSAG